MRVEVRLRLAPVSTPKLELNWLIELLPRLALVRLVDEPPSASMTLALLVKLTAAVVVCNALAGEAIRVPKAVARARARVVGLFFKIIAPI